MPLLPDAPGYTPDIFMPVIGPPASGDPASYYAGLPGTVSATLATEGVVIGFDAAASPQVFAMTGGYVRFVASGNPLPNGDLSRGSGTVHLQVWPQDVANIRTLLSSHVVGVPPMVTILYENVEPTSVRGKLLPLVQAIPEAQLRKEWPPTAPPPATLNDLHTNYLDKTMAGQIVVLVPPGFELGASAAPFTTSSATKEFVLRFLNSAGDDLSPTIHLREMPFYANARWTGHPLAVALAKTTAPLDLYLKFEVFNLTTNTFDALPAGITVKAMDANVIVADAVLGTATTDSNGKVHISVPNAASFGEKNPDLYFLAVTSGASASGHTLPAEWSTKDWKAVDGSAGYYENFAGTQLGDSASPLVFRVGVDVHARVVYELAPAASAAVATAKANLSNSTSVPVTGLPAGLAKVGMTFRALPDDDAYKVVNVTTSQLTLDRAYVGTHGSRPFALYYPAPPGIPVWFTSAQPTSTRMPSIPGPVTEAVTNTEGEVHLVVFEIESARRMAFGVWFFIEDASINLLRCETAAAKVPFDEWWYSGATDADTVAIPRDVTSIGKATAPRTLRLSSATGRAQALYTLKIARELGLYLYHVTGGAWPGMEMEVVPWAPAASFHWPPGLIHLSSDDHWDRGTIIHELSHGIMWVEVNNTTLGLAYEYASANGDASMLHYSNMLYTPEHALLEGWAEFVEAAFTLSGVPPFVATFRGRADVTQASDLVHVQGGGASAAWVGLFIYFEGDPDLYTVSAVTSSTIIKLDRTFQGTSRSGTSGPLFVVHRKVKVKQAYWEIPALGIFWPELNLFPGPGAALDNAGEAVEGELANALSAIYSKRVVPTTTTPKTIPESLNGDIVATAPWITQSAVEAAFLGHIYNPLKSLRPMLNPTSTALLTAIKTAQAANWHEISREILPFNVAAEAPVISAVNPSSGSSGQSITVDGSNFVVGMRVVVGSGATAKIVNTVNVASSTQLTFHAPTHAAGPVDIQVITLAGQASAASAFTYI